MKARGYDMAEHGPGMRAPGAAEAAAGILHELIEKVNHLTGAITRDRRSRWGCWTVPDYVENWGPAGREVRRLIADGKIRTHRLGRVSHVSVAEHRRVLAMLERDELGAVG